MPTRPLLILAAACALLGLAPAASALDEKPETPAAIQGGAVVTARDAKALLDGGKAQFFDMRSAVNYGKGHVPGAKALPYKEKSDFSAAFDASVDGFDLGALPADKAAAIVFYSDGPTGWKSYKAAVLAIRNGFRNVKWMREGFSGWLAARLPTE
jgi:rhodanese-related sulfurtransferase